MNKITYMLKFRHAADDFGIRNACAAERCENGKVIQISKIGRYIMPWRFICESMYALLLDEKVDSNIIIQADSFVIAQLNQNWNYFEFEQLQAQKRLNLEFMEVWDSNNHLNAEDVLKSIKNVKTEQEEKKKTEVDFLVVNRQRYDLANKPCGALVLMKRLNYERIAPPVIRNQGHSTEIIRQALIESIKCLKEPCYINIYMEPMVGLKTAYHGNKDDSLDALYELIRLGEHSFEIIHFTKHKSYKDLKERVSAILRDKMIEMENCKS